VRYDLIDRAIQGQLVTYCQQTQIAAIAFRPLGYGLAQIARTDPAGALANLAEQTGKTKAQVALHGCLAAPGGVVIPKASTAEHVAENYGASGWQISPGQVSELRRKIRYKRRGTLEMAFRRRALYFA